eukprot:TRINITY_DN49141_c0_g1_i3.p2 TRINITY_DN49141_c0_g1~~TRINITY_DN49141_c0_g1_i3.p2  ORF type:complete len:185 (-),score=26.22 TRINITY_DN49141_c0_g1_i3:17-571(-)
MSVTRTPCLAHGECTMHLRPAMLFTSKGATTPAWNLADTWNPPAALKPAKRAAPASGAHTGKTCNTPWWLWMSMLLMASAMPACSMPPPGVGGINTRDTFSEALIVLSSQGASWAWRSLVKAAHPKQARPGRLVGRSPRMAVSYTHLRAHETPEHLVCRLLLEKKKKTNIVYIFIFTRYYLIYD